MPATFAADSRTVEKLWSVTLMGHRLACELHPVGDLGWEVHLYRDGWMITSRRFVVHAEALEFSAELRQAKLTIELEPSPWGLHEFTAAGPASWR